ncbi:HNH endonuclease [Rahnella sp. EDr1-12]|uniref:HNH endonuclease n=1 Tax=unclassified Rahnella TaxID=2635087 RepID=UPI003BA857D8
MLDNKKWLWTGTEEYYVSEFGDIYNKKYERYISTPVNVETGYKYFSMGGKSRNVHEVVCTTFHGVKSHPDLTVEHRNRIKTDNHRDNLMWATQSQNNNNRVHKGTKAPLLTNHEYMLLINEYATGKHSLKGIRDWANVQFNRYSEKMVYCKIMLGKSYTKWFCDLPSELRKKIREITKSNTTNFTKKN